MGNRVIANLKKLFTKHLFQHCFELTENTNLTNRKFWKEHYNFVVCIRLIDMALEGATKRTLSSAWRKLWPDVVSERDFQGFEPKAEVMKEIVSLGKTMGQ